jgi:hypothetical protein
MEPEGSLPSSQELSTCTYPEPDQYSPQHSILSLKCTLKYKTGYEQIYVTLERKPRDITGAETDMLLDSAEQSAEYACLEPRVSHSTVTCRVTKRKCRT